MQALRSTLHHLITLLVMVSTLFGLVIGSNSPVHSQDAPSQKIESDDGLVMRDGIWLSQTASGASSGSYLYNNGAAALSLNFSGPSLEIIYISGPTLGTLAIEVDGTVLRTVITTNSATAYQQSAKINYLTDEPHELKVYAQGGGIVAIDAFIASHAANVERGSGSEVALSEIASGPRLCDPSHLTHRVSVASDGTQGNADSTNPSLSADGRFVAFESEATNLVAGDTSWSDIFVRDRLTCTTTRVSVASDGTPGNHHSSHPSISADGRYVAFQSNASNLAPNDLDNGRVCFTFCPDVFLHDRQTGITIGISIPTPPTVEAGGNGNPTISASGNTIGYIRNVTISTTTTWSLFVYHVPTATATSYGGNLNSTIDPPIRFSADEQYVGYSMNFAAPFPNGGYQVILRGLQNATYEVVSSTPTGEVGNGNSYLGGISANGQIVSFVSSGTNLINGTATGGYWRDLQTDTTYAIAPGSFPNASGNQAPAMSQNGRYILLRESAAPLTLYDRVRGSFTQMTTHDGQPVQFTYNYDLSADGRYAAYDTFQANVVLGDTNGREDVFVALAGGPYPPDTLTLFNPTLAATSQLNTLQSNPPSSAYNTYTLGSLTGGQWVMGDWDGDGLETPGVLAGGAFYYTNTNAAGAAFTAIWLGPNGVPLAGRFDAAVNHDCAGVVEQGYLAPYTVFVLYYACNLTSGPTPPIRYHWISAPLNDQSGFGGLGAHQFATGDYNADGVESVAVRRGPYIAFTNVPPTTIPAEFTFAQYFTATGADYGQLVVGDWDGDIYDTFGLFYSEGLFYRRNDLDWVGSPYLFQYVGQPIGTPVTAHSRHFP